MTARLFVSIMICMVLSVSSSFAIQYSIIDLGTLDGESASHAYAINEDGVVVGDYNGRAFKWEDGVISELIDTNTNTTMLYARGVNDSGQIVGQNYLYDSGTLTDLGADYCAIDINNSGDIVGFTYGTNRQYFIKEDSNIIRWGGPAENFDIAINENGQIAATTLLDNNKSTATYYENNTQTNLNDSNPSYRMRASLTYDINDSGTIVGLYHGSNYPDYPDTSNKEGILAAVKWEDGVMTVISTQTSEAKAINNNGQIVGDMDSRFVENDGGFYWSADTGFTDLGSLIVDNPGWVIDEVNDINDQGQIVGYGLNPDNELHGFLLTPVIEWQYIEDAQQTYELELSETQIDNLYGLWEAGKNDEDPDPIEIDGYEWSYFDETYPDKSYGDVWSDDEYLYIYLGSGLKTPIRTSMNSVPEPLSIFLLLSAMATMFIYKAKNKGK